MTTTTVEEQDLALTVKEVIASAPEYPDTAAISAAYIKNILAECCKTHGANKTVIWGLLDDEEKTTFKQLLSASIEDTPYNFPERLPIVKSSKLSPSMQQQNCITELITGKRWRRAMLIASKTELETAIGNLGKNSDRLPVIQEFIERMYPEKKNKLPVKRK